MAKYYYCLERINGLIGIAWRIHRILICGSFIRSNWKKTSYYNIRFSFHCWLTDYGIRSWNICPYDWKNYSGSWCWNSFNGCSRLPLRSLSNLVKRRYCSKFYIGCYFRLTFCKHNSTCMWSKLEAHAWFSCYSCIHLVSLDVFHARVTKMAC